MQKYELVLMLDAALQEKDRQNTVLALEKEIKGCIITKDEIGLKQTVYDLERKRGNNNFYFYSYHLNAENKNLDAIKKQLLYNKAVARYFIYKMKDTDDFFMFEDKVNGIEPVFFLAVYRVRPFIEDKKVVDKWNQYLFQALHLF